MLECLGSVLGKGHLVTKHHQSGLQDAANVFFVICDQDLEGSGRRRFSHQEGIRRCSDSTNS